MSSLKAGNVTAAFTIVTPNHLAHAYSLQKSFLRHNPGSVFVIGIIGYKVHVPETKEHSFVYLDELNDNRVTGMTQRYNPFELSCALKPYFAKHILCREPQIGRLIYLDGDMYVFNAFTEQTGAAITLSPHRTVHVNFLPGMDNFSAVNLLRYGVYNAGYFEVTPKPEAFRFLDWWQALVEHHAYNKPDEHVFVDQLWLNLVHSFFDDIFINKNPGYNVSVWNMIERKLCRQENGYTVNGVPLIMFHYSTYSMEVPNQLLNFDHPALSFAALPELELVFEIYREGLLEAGYEQVKQIPHPFTYTQPGKNKKWWRKLFSRTGRKISMLL